MTACAVGIVVANAVAAAAAAVADTATAVTTAAVMPKSLLFLTKSQAALHQLWRLVEART